MKVRQSSRSGRSFVALLSRPAGGSARASPAPPNLPGARTIRPAQLAGLRRPALALRARQLLVALPVGEPSEHCSWCARGRQASLFEQRCPSRAPLAGCVGRCASASNTPSKPSRHFASPAPPPANIALSAHVVLSRCRGGARRVRGRRAVRSAGLGRYATDPRSRHVSGSDARA